MGPCKWMEQHDNGFKTVCTLNFFHRLRRASGVHNAQTNPERGESQARLYLSSRRLAASGHGTKIFPNLISTKHWIFLIVYFFHFTFFRRVGSLGLNMVPKQMF